MDVKLRIREEVPPEHLERAGLAYPLTALQKQNVIDLAPRLQRPRDRGNQPTLRHRCEVARISGRSQVLRKPRLGTVDAIPFYGF